MFDRKRPCADCPFRKGRGSKYRLSADRLEEIRTATAFQCHKTVDYDQEEESRAGNTPQQCAGLMAVLHAEDQPNQIMRVAERVGYFDPEKLETRTTYASWDDVLAAHVDGREVG